ncbi:MAG: glycosyltransferase [Pseudomonadota bacterium]
MRVVHLSNGDATWGAFRATYRVHKALQEAGVDSELWVDSKSTDDPSVFVPRSKLKRKLRAWLYRRIRNWAHSKGYDGIVSPGWVPSGFHRRIQSSRPDVTHLHWVNHDMLSLKDIGKIPGPVVWTLHDMWAFSGSDHYPDDERWKTGYETPVSTFDFDRWVWQRKKTAWVTPRVVIAPSSWLAGCARQSELFRNWRVEVIPNPIDCNAWRPVDAAEARAKFGIHSAKQVVLFGAVMSTTDSRKGYDLLVDALARLKAKTDTTELVVFGSEDGHIEYINGYPVRSVGIVSDDSVLQQLYSAADVMVVPSRLEAFGQTASEAMACGTPVVAFDNSGLADVVAHNETGYLARAFATSDLAVGIDMILSLAAAKRDGSDTESYTNIATASRNRAVDLFSCPVVAAKIQALYEDVL